MNPFTGVPRNVYMSACICHPEQRRGAEIGSRLGVPLITGMGMSDANHATSGRKRPHSIEDWNQLCLSFLLFLIYSLDFPLVTIRRNTFEQVYV
jgi:hypothetical protein